jgi:hypothetical protein
MKQKQWLERSLNLSCIVALQNPYIPFTLVNP